METKPKQKLFFRIFWLELGINLFILTLFFIWFAVFKNPIGTAKYPPPAVPRVLGAISEPLRGIQEPREQLHFIATGNPELADISAKSYLVFNVEDGMNLLEKNANQKLGIASLTKLLTAYVAYQTLDLTSDTRINPFSTPSITPSLGLVPGDTVKLQDLFNAMLVGSENDAADVLAQGIRSQTGQTATSLMNETADSLGMSDSHFGNPYGFDFGNNYSTANDLKKLITVTQSLHAFKSLEKKTNYNFKSALGNNYFAKATNRLVGSHSNIFAIKTGYTETTLGSIALKTYLEDKPVVVIVIGSQNREKDALRLIEEINMNFKLSP